MLLTEARRAARTDSAGALVPLAEQDRSTGTAMHQRRDGILNAALKRRKVGEYQLLASIAALHDEAPSDAETRWAEIANLYGLLSR